MINLDPIPPLPHMHESAVKFLDLMADPAAARKLMDDLKTAKNMADLAHDEAKKLQAKVVKDQRKHEQDLKTFETNRQAHSAFLEKTGQELDVQAKSLAAREEQLPIDSAAIDKREAAVAERERALTASEQAHGRDLNLHANAAAKLQADREFINEALSRAQHFAAHVQG